MKQKMILTERKRQKRAGYEHVRCNLCQKVFRAASRYHRFCRTCRQDEELFRFSDWLGAQGAG